METTNYNGGVEREPLIKLDKSAVILPDDVVVEIKNGLKALGVHGVIALKCAPPVVVVTCDGKYFGLWDSAKKTFVD